LFCLWLMHSRFGSIVQCIRENQNRLEFLGYNPAVFKIVLFVISGAIAGLAGMLYAPTNSFISPSDVGLDFSNMIVVWLAVGGRGNLTGALWGAFLVTWAESLLSEAMAGYWQLIIGVLILAVVFFIPNGVIGTILKTSPIKRLAVPNIFKKKKDQ